MFAWLIRIGIAFLVVIVLAVFWFQGVLGHFLDGLTTMPPTR